MCYLLQDKSNTIVIPKLPNVLRVYAFQQNLELFQFKSYHQKSSSPVKLPICLIAQLSPHLANYVFL